MVTKKWKVDKFVDNLKSYPQIREAASLLKANEVVAFPTETVYGLGGNALSDEAIKKIYEAKGRPSDNPLIVHVSSVKQLDDLCSGLNEQAEELIKAFWPGPLTLILPSTGHVSEKVTAGLSTVAIRMPEDPIAKAVIEASGLPIAAPSANLSGRPSPTTAAHVLRDLDGRVAGVIDGGETGVGVESTVVDCTSKPITILRPGGITKEQLEAVIGEVGEDPALTGQDKAPKSPGMKYRHYAPAAPVYIVHGGMERIKEVLQQANNENKKTGVLTTDENKDGYPEADFVVACGRRSVPESVAHHLYQALREFDDTDVEIIFSESFPNEGIGAAIMNRLTKAAGGREL
ncbi:L-threonylcarbamoyladenylate synthase [Scopulibacillus darangshiensis]|nr:L-threonylcarbamoyladenylate synthase [Scopulibacillus darangshiensis]